GARRNAVGPLVDALADPHPAVASRAAEALERLTGGTHGLDADAWRRHFAQAAPRPRDPEDETRTVADGHEKAKLKAGPIEGLIPTLYTIPIRAKRAIFVVDMSSSMRQGARSTHLDELKRALLSLPSDVLFNVLCFDQRMFFFTQAKSLVPATAERKAELERWVDTLPAGENTDVKRSVASGLAMLREALEADVQAAGELFLLTDGRETVQTMSDAHVESQFAKLPAGRCKVHVVSLGRHGTPALKLLADRTGGTYVETPAR
ncbi:MAG: vWA domain-containing protein, partial [Planctomycetota bacterium]